MIYRTNATNPDTDGDGYSDGCEIENNTDPLDSEDYPGKIKPKNDGGKNQVGKYIILMIVAIFIILILIIFALIRNKKAFKEK